ncbi:MAG: hypothetical protein K9H64_13920 [Bacteroidales bacterium]|nr:hypothetical protein [Bacteroidales bacterium]MCF8456709.1 hypothetical protein [Bacteroidales bacterium]
MKHIILTIGLMIVTGLFMMSIAQADYESCYEKDNLVISAKWVNSKTKDKKSPLELRLKIENKSPYDMEFSYEILLYMDKVLREKTEVEKYTIKAGKVKVGKWNGIRFLPTTLNNKDINSKSFSWEINVEDVVRPPVVD